MRTSIKCVLAFFAMVIILGLALTLFSDNTEARTCVWDGGAGDYFASSAANWDTDTTPAQGDDLVFSGGKDCLFDISTDSLGLFSIDGFTGVITQTSDVYISGYYQTSGTFWGEPTKSVYCSGSWTKTGGTHTANKVNIVFSGTGDVTSNSSPDFLTTIFNGETVIKSDVSTFAITVNNGHSVSIASGKALLWDMGSPGKECVNDGIIAGDGTLKCYSYNLAKSLSLGVVSVADILFYLPVWGGASSSVTMLGDATCVGSDILVKSDHATYTMTIDISEYELNAASITVDTRSILLCGEGNIYTSTLISTSGTIIEETATWEFVNATVTATSGQKFYNVHMNGWVDFTNSVNVTNELMFVDVPSEYDDLDVYLDTVYSSTIPSPYTFGPEITFSAKYEYEPDVQIEISQFYEDTDFSIYAYISSNLPVTYNITGTASDWLSYHEGRIIGMPPDIGNYTYTITATHESGSVDIVSGHILVGQLDTAEYNFDFVWGLLLWSIITIFMVFGYLREIPLMQMVVWAISFGNIVATIRIENFGAFVALFAICNTIIFFIGMARWRS